MKSGKKILTRLKPVFLTILVLGLQDARAMAQAPRESGEPKVDYAAARREIQSVESAINALLNATFANPFGLVNRTKGVYLPGYGQVFNFLINIQRAVISTPFGEYASGQEITPAQKRKRIDELKDRLVRLMMQHGPALQQVRPNELVTVVAFFEDRNFPDEESQNRTIVLSAVKRDLEEWASRQDKWLEFKQRMKIIEY